MEKIGEDVDAMERGTFSWLDIDAIEIDKKTELIKKFHFTLTPARLNLLNTNCIEEIYTLQFIDSITSTDSLTENSKNFVEVLMFDDNLLQYFMKYYIETDMVNLDKIDAVNLESLHPIARSNIRKKNFENSFFMNKYFRNNFNLFEFALKIINRYVPIKTYNVRHKTHTYGILICNKLIEYGIVSMEQLLKVSQLIYEKLESFKKFESDINDKNLSDEWVDDATLIRKCYSEIMIHILYIRQDTEMLQIIGNIMRTCPNLDNYDLIASQIKFSDDTIFNRDLGNQVLEILLGYILSQNKVKENIIAPKEILDIADNYLNMFSNMTDPFLLSINILSKDDLVNFVRPFVFPQQKNLLVSEYASQIHDVQLSVYKAEEALIVQNAVKQLCDILEKFSVVFQVDISNYENELYLKGLQLCLNENNIFVRFIMFLDGLDVEYLNEGFISYFCKFCKIFLYKNTETQCIFLQEYYFSVIRKLITKYPDAIFSILVEIFSITPRILLANNEFLFQFLKYHEQFKPESLITPNEASIKLSITILKLLKIYITDTKKKDYINLPEYDILIGDYLGSLLPNFKTEDFKIIFTDEKYDNLYKEHAFLYLELLSGSIEYRFTRKTYDILSPVLDFEFMKSMVDLVTDFDQKGIFHELFTHVNVDFKNNLLNQRNGFYVRKPVDMQYDEDIMVAKPYNDYIDYYLNEIEKILKDSEKLGKEDERLKRLYYLNNYLFFPLFKAFNLFSLVKDSDLGQLKDYIPRFEKCDTLFFQQIDRFSDFYQTNFFSKEELNKKIDTELNFGKLKDKFIREKLLHRHLIVSIKDFIQRVMNFQPENGRPLKQMRLKMINPKNILDRMKKCSNEILLYSNLVDKRKDAGCAFLEDLAESMKKKGIDVVRMLGSFYRMFKHEKLSHESSTNIYISTLNNKDFKDAQIYSYNLCYFIHNQLTKDYIYGYKTYFYMLVESLTNVLFVATKAIQTNYFKIIKETNEMRALDKIFLQMKFIMNYLKHKNTFDKFYKETYTRCLICMKFHQFICEENCKDFKDLFGTKNCPDDSVDRVQRFTTIYQRITDLCEYHNNYNPKVLGSLTERNRPHLLLMCAYSFDCLSEFVGGPYEPNQLKVYKYIYDRYNGTLKRYMIDANSHFNVLKESLCDFMVSMADGYNDEVITFLTINYEIKTISNLMTFGIIQLCREYKKRKLGNYKMSSDKHNIQIYPLDDQRKVDDFDLKMTDYFFLVQAFRESEYFNSHTLLEMSIKLFKFLQYVGKVRAKFQMFVDDRNYAMKSLFNRLEKAIPEREIVVWKFLSKIVTKLEFLNENHDLDTIYYARPPKCELLSQESKNLFYTETADRTSIETKITSLSQNIPIFEQEMDFAEASSKRLINFLSTSGAFVFLQYLGLFISMSINILLLIDYRNSVTPPSFSYTGIYTQDIKALAIVEIIFSTFVILLWIIQRYGLTYSLNKKRFMIMNNIEEKDLTKVDKLKLSIYNSFFNKDVPMVFVFHIIMMILGLSVSFGFYGIDMLALINLAETFRYVVKSITLHGDQLIATYILGIIIMLAYTLFLHTFWMEAFTQVAPSNLVGLEDPTSTANESICVNLVRCFWAIINDGFKNGSGIIALMSTEYFGPGNYQWYFPRLITELTFFLIINVTLLNIIFGITIDTFAQMRDQRQKFGFIK